jgi:hypothetical protein
MIKMAYRTLTLSYKDIANNSLICLLLSAIFLSYLNAFKQRQTCVATLTLTQSYKDIANNILNCQLLSAIFLSYQNAFKQRQTCVAAFYDENGLQNFSIKLQRYCKQSSELPTFVSDFSIIPQCISTGAD